MEMCTNSTYCQAGVAYVNGIQKMRSQREDASILYPLVNCLHLPLQLVRVLNRLNRGLICVSNATLLFR